jgi:hypothetical protein
MEQNNRETRAGGKPMSVSFTGNNGRNTQAVTTGKRSVVRKRPSIESKPVSKMHTNPMPGSVATGNKKASGGRKPRPVRRSLSQKVRIPAKGSPSVALSSGDRRRIKKTSSQGNLDDSKSQGRIRSPTEAEMEFEKFTDPKSGSILYFNKIMKVVSASKPIRLNNLVIDEIPFRDTEYSKWEQLTNAEKAGGKSPTKRRIKISRTTSAIVKDGDLPEFSCCCLSKRNPLRKVAIKVCANPLFDHFVLFLIVLNSITIGMSDPLDVSTGANISPLNEFLETTELVFNICFTVELVFKIIALGFIRGDQAYLKDSWNRLDFFIVVCGWLPFILQYANLNVDVNVSAVRTVRVLKILRSVKSISGMRLLVQSLISSLPMLGDVITLLCLIFFIFGIIGLQFFAGNFRYTCWMPTNQVNSTVNTTWALADGDQLCSALPTPPSGSYVCDEGQVCDYKNPGTGAINSNPENGLIAFDNIGVGILTIFTCITLEGWVDVMYLAIDQGGAGAAFYFIFLILIGALFVLNLFVAVIVDAYYRKSAEIKEELASNKSKEQDARRQVVRGLASDLSKLEKSKNDPSQNITKCEYYRSRVSTLTEKFVTHLAFETLITFLILVNTVVLALEKFDPAEYAATGRVMSLEYQGNLDIVNEICTYAFILEMALKLCGLGLKGYVADAFNVFDGVIVTLSIVEKLIPGDGAGFSVFRTFRLLRVFKLARSWTSLRILIHTTLKSAPGMVYFMMLLAVYLYIYALVGMEMFGGKYTPKWGFASVPRANFDDLNNSLLTVFQVLTGENWNEVLYNSMSIGGLESQILTAIFFISMYVMGNFISLNLFLAILLDNFASGIEEEMENAVSDPTLFDDRPHTLKLKSISEAFDRFDIDNSGLIDPAEFKLLIFNLGVPMTDSQCQQVFAFLDSDRSGMIDRQEFLRWSMQKRHEQMMEESNNQSVWGKLYALVCSKPAQDSPDEKIAEIGYDTESANIISSRMKRQIGKRKLSGKQMIDLWIKEGAVRTRAQGLVLGQCLMDRWRDVGHPGIKLVADVQDKKQQKSSTNLQTVATKTPEYALKDALFARFQDDVNTYYEFGRQRKTCSESGAVPVVDQAFTERQKAVNKIKSRASALVGKSLFCLPPENYVRRLAVDFMLNKWFDRIVYVLIAISSVLLVVDNPSVPQSDEFKQNLLIIDIVITTLFVVEMLTKIIAMGFYGNRYAYLRDGWNKLDFIIVVISLINLTLSGIDLKFLKGVRALRAMRPLRVISRLQGMKMVVNSMLASIPAIGNVLLICLLFLLVFSIMGVQFFKGRFYYCHGFEADEYHLSDRYRLNRDQCIGDFIDADGSNATRVWKNPTVGQFDHIGIAMLTLFEVSSLEMWPDVAFLGRDVTNYGKHPEVDSSVAYGWYFVVYVFTCSFFAVNLFVGVVVDKYNEISQKNNGLVMLTAGQRDWVEMQKLMMRTGPEYIPNRPTEKWRQFFYDFVTWHIFELFIMACILLNTLTMAATHYDAEAVEMYGISDPEHFMSPQWNAALNSVNWIFFAVFVSEAILKVLGVGWQQYWAVSWNKFDFIIVLGSILAIFLKSLIRNFNITILRVFRIARIFRLVKSSRGLRNLLSTLIFSLPSLYNVGALLLLLFYVYAVMGMNLFGEVKSGEFINRNANFRTFGKSMLILYRCATGESWNGVMHDIMISTKSIVLPTMFFVSYCVMGMFVMLNLFVAVILENFSDIVSADTKEGLRPQHLENFEAVWGEVADRGAKYIPVLRLPELLNNLKPPLGFNGLDTLHGQRVIDYIKRLSLKQHEDKNGDNCVYFIETLLAIASMQYKKSDLDLPPDAAEVQEEMATRLHRKHPGLKRLMMSSTANLNPNIINLESEFKAARIIQGLVRKKQARRRRKELIKHRQMEKTAGQSLLSPSIFSGVQAGIKAVEMVAVKAEQNFVHAAQRIEENVQQAVRHTEDHIEDSYESTKSHAARAKRGLHVPNLSHRLSLSGKKNAGGITCV